jgi:hypothetical protein
MAFKISDDATVICRHPSAIAPRDSAAGAIGGSD